MKKLLFFFLALALNMNFAFASVDKIIKTSELNDTSTIAVSIKNVKNKSVLYEYNQKKLLHPASILKVLTTASTENCLKNTYKFETKMYQDSNRNVYIKLAADPFLSTEDLKQLAKDLRLKGNKNVNKIYIDDSIFDNVEYQKGWMADYELKHYIPKISAYNLNRNCLNLNISFSPENKVIVQTNSMMSFPIMNCLKKGNETNIIVERNFFTSDENITLKGTVAKSTNIYVSVLNPKRNFISTLDCILREHNIKYFGQYTNKKVPSNAKLISTIEHTLDNCAYEKILKNSDNFLSETLFKLCPVKMNNEQGTFDNASKIFYSFYSELKPNNSKIKLADSSGISRNNLITADFITDALIFINDKNQIKSFMPQGNQGTLTNRFFDFRDKIWAKTGTLSNISAICGYIKNKKSEDICFSIIIQNFSGQVREVKQFEDEIIKAIYKDELK